MQLESQGCEIIRSILIFITVNAKTSIDGRWSAVLPAVKGRVGPRDSRVRTDTSDLSRYINEVQNIYTSLATQACIV